jgi:hypothetical protein
MILPTAPLNNLIDLVGDLIFVIVYRRTAALLHDLA